MKNLHVCLVAPFAPRKGGVTVQTELLARYLERDGVDVLRVNTNLHSLRRRGWGPLRLVLQPWVVLLRLLKNMPAAQVVHFQAASYWGYMPTFIGVPLGKLFGKRCVVSYQGGGGPRFVDRLGCVVRFPMKLADVVTTCSLELRDEFDKRGVETVLLRNLYDSDVFTLVERGEPAPRLVWTRSMEPIYDPMMALRAFEIVQNRYPDASLIMTSDGSLRAEMERYIEDENLRGVILPGRVPTEAVARFMHEASICINTSRVDGLPTALLEASATGLPVVTTPAGGIASLFEDGVSARFVGFGDHEAMAEAVCGLLEEPAEYRRLGEAAREVAAEYGWDRTSKELGRIYGLTQAGADVPGDSLGCRGSV